ncbi:F-box/LRR-repeat protein 7-like [Mytilus californianus]|uniref:F-box/LRR-repeat protein 7-like n=1 Tax=Mytilus californianus TaxID=6549 RepID=UPI002247162F|nr:F-box/LRR-repeat protein 7-like [Mytilus californianus]XP_052066284.1 F-box/LRR-repeat protein 7-like [Mytilus californianus]
MNINDLPAEMLIEIFTYLPEWDFLRNARHVCQLWNLISTSPILRQNVELNKYMDSFAYPLKYFSAIQLYIKKLVMHSTYIQTFEKHYQDVKFENLKSLHITSKVQCTWWPNSVFNNFFSMFPNFQIIKITPDFWKDAENCLYALSKYSIIELDFGYYGSTVYGGNLHDLHYRFIQFVHGQRSLKILKIRASHYFAENTVAQILEICPTLTSLNISGAYVSAESFKMSTNGLALTEFSMKSQSEFGDDDLEALTKRTSCLKTLNIEGCSLITERGFLHIAFNCSHLKRLFIGELNSNCVTDLSSDVITKIAKACPHLEFLSAIGCSKLEDDCIMDLASSCGSLLGINLNGCTNITDISLFALADHCPLLNVCEIRNSAISLKGAMYLIQNCKGLTKLNTSNCNNIDDTNVSELENMLDTQSQTYQPRTNSSINSELDMSRSKMHCFHAHLKDLDLSESMHVTRTLVTKLTKILPDLISLRLSISADIDSDKEWFQEIFENCVCLSEFKLSTTTIRRQDYLK